VRHGVATEAVALGEIVDDLLTFGGKLLHVGYGVNSKDGQTGGGSDIQGWNYPPALLLNQAREEHTSRGCASKDDSVRELVSVDESVFIALKSKTSASQHEGSAVPKLA
jgi:hypothetical protein